MLKKQKNSLLCPQCRRLISSDEPMCPYCGMIRPGAWWKKNPLAMGFSQADKLIRTVMFINIGMFALTLMFKPNLSGISFNPFYFLSPDTGSLILLGATGTLPIDRMQRWWTLISANYLHGGLLHIVFNMLVFRQLATLVIREYGTHRMFAIYTIGGIAGFWVSYLAGIRITIGASAAVCGLIGAILYYGKSRGGIYGQLIYKQVGAWAISIFIFGLIVPGINNWGHGGGLFGGVLAGFLLGYREKEPEKPYHKTLAWVFLLVTLLVLSWAVFSGIYYRLQR